jgi:hypothetical protein
MLCLMAILIQEDTLFLFQDSLDQIDHVIGYHNGQIFSNHVQGISDSLYYSKKEIKLTLFKSPYLWNKNAQISGAIIHLLMKDLLLNDFSLG